MDGVGDVQLMGLYDDKIKLTSGEVASDTAVRKISGSNVTKSATTYYDKVESLISQRGVIKSDPIENLSRSTSPVSVTHKESFHPQFCESDVRCDSAIQARLTADTGKSDNNNEHNKECLEKVKEEIDSLSMSDHALSDSVKFKGKERQMKLAALALHKYILEGVVDQ